MASRAVVALDAPFPVACTPRCLYRSPAPLPVGVAALRTRSLVRQRQQTTWLCAAGAAGDRRALGSGARRSGQLACLARLLCFTSHCLSDCCPRPARGARRRPLPHTAARFPLVVAAP